MRKKTKIMVYVKKSERNDLKVDSGQRFCNQDEE